MRKLFLIALVCVVLLPSISFAGMLDGGVGLLGINESTKPVQLEVVGATTSVSTGDGKGYFTIPNELNGWSLSNVEAIVITKGITGTTNITIERKRATVVVDVLSTPVTVGNEYFARDGVVNVANNGASEGDSFRVNVDTVHSGTAPLGLYVTLVFSKP